MMANISPLGGDNSLQKRLLESTGAGQASGLEGVKSNRSKGLLEHLAEAAGKDDAYKVDLSPEVLSRLQESGQVPARFVELVKQGNVGEQPDKVKFFKELIAKGQVGEYLDAVGSDRLAAALTSNPLSPFYQG